MHFIVNRTCFKNRPCPSSMYSQFQTIKGGLFIVTQSMNVKKVRKLDTRIEIIKLSPNSHLSANNHVHSDNANFVHIGSISVWIKSLNTFSALILYCSSQVVLCMCKRIFNICERFTSTSFMERRLKSVRYLLS